MKALQISLSGNLRFIFYLFSFCLLSSSLQAEPVHSHNLDPNAPKIREIRIQVGDIFEGENLEWFYQTANRLKIKTRSEVIRRELLFKEGDPFNAFSIQESERVIRGLRYIHKVAITPKFDGNFVDIVVYVQDTWTLIPSLSYSFGSGSTDQMAVGITESDLLGYGKRAELLYRDENGRTSIEGVWEDNRVWDSHNNLLLGYFDRSDGNRYLASFGKPYRSLETKRSWSINTDFADGVGKLYSKGDERFIFGQEKIDFSTYYSFATGDPDILIHRYTFGYELNDYSFSEASLSDFDNVDVDPNSVLNDPSLIPNSRKFSYPFFAYRRIEPDFVSHNYVDRFDRVQDFNLGNVFSTQLGYAPTVFGSDENAWLMSINDSDGFRVNGNSFFRGEIGAASRYSDNEFYNSLFRAELKFVYLMGPRFIGNSFIGNHTLVASTNFNYGDNLDGEREFYLGSSTGLRGYDSRTFFGDKYISLNLEDRFHLVDDILRLVSLGGAFFVDVGGITTDSLSSIISDELYGDFGVGLRLGFPKSSGARVVRLDFAVPFRDGPDGTKGYEVRLVVNGGQLFEALLESERFGPDNVNVDTGFSD
ncbi:MAG: hypothetical protein SGJ02_12160 [bacterium]|nr:hypothetical protein [bacterium]